MKKTILLFTMAAVLGAMGCKKDDGTEEEPPPNNNTPRTEVPDELVGAWENGSIDFTLWENYREGYWAGRNAVPTREAMVFSKNGDAKFYRYEFGLNQYEELIDCEGTVAFNIPEGTFTFYPVKGRKRYYDSNYAPNNQDRPLTSSELTSPKLAGKRAYSYQGTAPTVIQIKVPTSAPYNWYKKQ
jgi:hypothetical protein